MLDNRVVRLQRLHRTDFVSPMRYACAKQASLEEILQSLAKPGEES